MATTKAGTAPAREGSDGVSETMAAELGQVDEQLRALVKERPVLALLSAVAAGYLVGRLLRRRA
jgi:hypothetical protein